MAKPVVFVVAVPISDARGKILCNFAAETLARYEHRAARGTVRVREPGERGPVNFKKYDASANAAVGNREYKRRDQAAEVREPAHLFPGL